MELVSLVFVAISLFFFFTYATTLVERKLYSCVRMFANVFIIIKRATNVDVRSSYFYNL